MTDGPTDDWRAMMQRFDALGHAADVALDHEAADVSQLLEERDALLEQLTAALAHPSSDPGALIAALSRSSQSTATLLSKVAERTDALRRALRTVDHGARVTHAYQLTHGGAGFLDARR